MAQVNSFQVSKIGVACSKKADLRREVEVLILTDYQAKYIAHKLTRRFPSDSAEKLTASLVDAQVDLNPHQIDAALFAFKSPLSKGALLADKLALGKTIRVSPVLSHKWAEHDARFFETEAAKLDGWADDLKLGLEREIKELDQQIKEARRAATAALTLEEKLAGQKQIRALENQRNQKRRSLFDAQDEVDEQREELIARIEEKLRRQTGLIQLFAVRWALS